jgi:hypothetical protein
MKAHGPARARERGIENAAFAAGPRWPTLVSAGALVLALGSSTPAQGGTVTLIPAGGPVGASAVATGRGFPARARILVRADGVRRAAPRVDREGRFAASLTVHGAGRSVVKVVSVSRAHRVVNVFKVRAAGGPSGGEVDSESGARARWTPLEGRSGSALTVSLRHFPARQGVIARLGATRLATARTNRRGRATLRLNVPPRRPGRYPVTVKGRGRALQFDFIVTSTEATAPPAIDEGSCVPRSRT